MELLHSWAIQVRQDRSVEDIKTVATGGHRLVLCALQQELPFHYLLAGASHNWTTRLLLWTTLSRAIALSVIHISIGDRAMRIDLDATSELSTSRVSTIFMHLRYTLRTIASSSTKRDAQSLVHESTRVHQSNLRQVRNFLWMFCRNRP
jgi:hypothetical protein